MPVTKDGITIDEFKSYNELLGMKKRSKARLRGDGPRFVKIGRSVRYLQSSVLDYIKSRTRHSTSEM